MKFVSYELSKKLKEKGFPQRPDYFNYSSYYEWDGLRKIHSLSNASVWFDPNISRNNIYFAPTISQVLKWLREEKKIHIQIIIYENGWYFEIWQYYGSPAIFKHQGNKDYHSYEQTAIAGIEYVIDNLI